MHSCAWRGPGCSHAFQRWPGSVGPSLPLRSQLLCCRVKPGSGDRESLIKNGRLVLPQAPELGPVKQPPPVVASASSSASLVSSQQDPLQTARVLWKRLLIDLSSLPRAIALMAATFGFSALGTFIPQNKAFEYYVENYPEAGSKVLGFLTYNWIFLLDLDHIYSSWYFYFTLLWLAASLAACTSTRQWPAVRVAQRWRFLATPDGVVRQGQKDGMAEVLPNARLRDVAQQLSSKGYQVFVKEPSMYAFKGLAGRIGPIGVHAAMLLILAGTSYSGFGGCKGTVMIPEGEGFTVGDVLHKVSPVASLPGSVDKVLRVNKFKIDYRPDGSVAQFYSDLSLLDPSQAPALSDQPVAVSTDEQPSGKELLRKTISVNDPFRYGGLTMYQTDWSLSSVQVRVLGPALGPTADTTATPTPSTSHSDETAGSDPSSLSQGPSSSSPSSAARSGPTGDVLSLPMASLEGKPGIAGRLWGSYLPVAAPNQQELEAGKAPRGISILARDPQSVIFYDTKGIFVGVRRPGSGKPIEVEGIRLIAEGITGATGLEIKSDPGVPLVYAGFGALMVTTLVSYLSHSQVWALQQGPYVYVAGRSNRAKLGFSKEIGQVLNAVPEDGPAPAGTASGR